MFNAAFFSSIKVLPDVTGDVQRRSISRDHLRVPDAHHGIRTTNHRHSIYSQDIDLPDTVANFVDFVKEGRHNRHRYRHNMHTRYRGITQ